MDDIRILKRFKNGDFYLVAFIVGFIIFALLSSIVQLAAIGIVNSKIPNFGENFIKLIAERKFSELTPAMWGVLNVSQFISTLLLGGIILAFIWRTLIRDAKRFKKEIWHNIGMIVFGFFFIMILLTAMNMIYKYFGIEGTSENQEIINNSLSASTRIFMLISVVVLAPIVEELLFRRLLFGALEDKFKLPKIVSVIASAVIFAALHAVDIFFFQYFLMALVLCSSYSISKNNILVPIGIHFLNNSTALFLVIIQIL